MSSEISIPSDVIEIWMVEITNPNNNRILNVFFSNIIIFVLGLFMKKNIIF